MANTNQPWFFDKHGNKTNVSKPFYAVPVVKGTKRRAKPELIGSEGIDVEFVETEYETGRSGAIPDNVGYSGFASPNLGMINHKH